MILTIIGVILCAVGLCPSCGGYMTLGLFLIVEDKLHFI